LFREIVLIRAIVKVINKLACIRFHCEPFAFVILTLSLPKGKNPAFLLRVNSVKVTRSVIPSGARNLIEIATGPALAMTTFLGRLL